MKDQNCAYCMNNELVDAFGIKICDLPASQVYLFKEQSHRGRVIVVAQMDAPSYWTYSIRVGARVALYNTGSGHVLLAFHTNEEREMMIAENLGSSGDHAAPSEARSSHGRPAEVDNSGRDARAELDTGGGAEGAEAAGLGRE